MDPSDRPTEFRESIGGDRSRVPAYLVIAAVVLLVAFGFVTNQTGEGTDEASPPTLTASAPVAAATPGRTFSPTPVPTPVPTLAPFAAPVTTAELSRTGVLVAYTGDPAIGSLVADVNGTIWTTRAGGVINVDLQTGRAREWTLADDPAFATAWLAPARQGGVWLVSPGAVRLFDGERFRAVIEMPETVWSVVESSDGSLWAQTDLFGLIRWADGTWASDPPGRPSRGAASIVVDAGGRVWTANYDQREGGEWTPQGISSWDGSAWTSFTSDDLPDMAGLWSPPSLVAGDDGSVWVAMGRELARFKAGAWTKFEVEDLQGNVSLSAVGADGKVWFVRDNCESCAVQIHAYDGSTLTTYDDEDGLPGANDVGWPWATVLPGPGYVVASTEAGMYRLTDGSWQQLDMSTPSGAPAPGSSPLGRGVGSQAEVTLAATSRTEVWAAVESRVTDAPQEGGLFRFDGTTWHRQQLPIETTVGQAVVAPDGALWVATGSGPLVRRNGVWLDLGATVGRVVPKPGEDRNGCGGVVFVGGDGVAYYAGPRSGNQVVALLPVGSAWTASLYPAPPVGDVCTTTLAVTADGTIWLLQRGWGNTLSRAAGRSWEVVPLLPVDLSDAQLNPAAIVVDRDGTLWVAANTYDPTTGTSHTGVMRQVDAQWVRRGGDLSIDYVQALAQLPDGSLVAFGDGIATFDGQAWRESWRGLWFDAVSVAPDGAVWVAGPNLYRLPPLLP